MIAYQLVIAQVIPSILWIDVTNHKLVQSEVEPTIERQLVIS